MARAEVLRMSRVLAHRGPDGEGVWTDRNVGLGHRRLAIIDLRSVASQPMANEDGTVWISFNGEIYNFQDLRSDLEGRGHRFRTNSDTEVIIHAYEEYGRACLTRLRGMFAFAIWDARRRRLFLARDRVGKKPLFYYLGPDRFLFASEIKALFADVSVPRVPDPASINRFLSLGYVPAPRTAFEGIRKLPAAHWLEVCDGRVKIERYWRLDYTPKRRIKESEAMAELEWHLGEAVRLRLVSDVPIGAFLSGGVDSSAVVAYMARQMEQPPKTFTAGFSDADYDERAFARIVAQRYNTEHTELLIRPKVSELLSRLVWHYDEPFGDVSAVPSYAIAELTRQHVTVVLNGDGADESFAGYDWYRMDRLFSRTDSFPLSLRKRLAYVAKLFPVGTDANRLMGRLNRAAELLSMAPARRYSQWTEHSSPAARECLYSDEFKTMQDGWDPDSAYSDLFQGTDGGDWVDVLLGADVNLYLADDLLVKMDRATMAHSLEARSPFLDHVLMEFVACLPAEFKLAWGRKKRILRKSLRTVLPDQLLDRPKMGFSVPVARWLREDLREMTHDVLLSSCALQRGYFRKNVLATLLREHCTEGADHGSKLWDLLMLELWHRTFIDEEPIIPNGARENAAA